MKNLTLFLFLIVIHNTAFSQSVNDNREDEKYLPLFHFSPADGWMSDPNGLFFYENEYHLFYQHIPNNLHGQHWGHAVSNNLLNWEHLPIALYPDSLGYIFSGCCVVDHHNTSGLGSNENPPVIAVFTYHNPNKGIKAESQAIAYSIDKGRTWVKYAGNPVIENPGIKDFRDPKVIWNKETGKWLMALASGPVIRFYESTNCIDWEYLTEFGENYGSHVGPWECPDFFPMKVKGSNEIKSVLLVSVVDFTDTKNRLSTATQYFIGDFDGKDFTSQQTDTLWIDYGKDCYAGVTFDNAPDERRIFVAWMNSHQYGGHARNAHTKSWSGAATFPRELSVVKENAGYRLNIEPVKELAKLYMEQHKLTKRKIEGSINISNELPFNTVPTEINLHFSTQKLPAKYGLRLKNNNGEYITLGFEKDKNQFYVDRTNATHIKFHDMFSSYQTAPFNPSKKMEWKVLVDTSSVELFVGDNKIVFSNLVFPLTTFDTIELFSEGGSVELKEGGVRRLKAYE